MTSILIIVAILILLFGGFRAVFWLIGAGFGLVIVAIALVAKLLFRLIFGGKILNFSRRENFENFSDFFSQNFSSNFNANFNANFQPQEFKKNYIQLLGKIGKLDGVISAEEARFISRTLDVLSASASERIYLKKAYQEAILQPQSYEQNAQMMAKTARGQIELQKALYSILQMAIIDGLNEGKLNALKNCARCWNLGRLLEQIFAQMGIGGGQNRAQYEQNSMSKKEALKILNLNENASAAEIKQAYRRLARKYHPDAHSSKNLSEKELAKITEKFRQINEAYEFLKKN